MHMSKNRIAAARKQWALSQLELSRLVGVSDASISRIEKGQRVPSLRLALRLELLFGIAPAELFPSLQYDGAKRLTGRAQTFSVDIEHRHGAAAERKRALLSELADRLTRLTADA